MWKLFALIHLLGATILSGVLVLIVLATPSLADSHMKLVPAAFIVGILLAIPPSLWATKAVLAQTKGQ
ncbi:MAG TPA: hypothetical protein PLQ11_07705 [Beijerinckiaceae bacterium]|nr:hypothetical protein [Beijerinckiaceae bacterium]